MTFTLLGNRLTLPQPPKGHKRPPEDALWLAASLTPQQPDATVLDAGCGSGAVGLALLARCPQLHVMGLDADATLTACAIQATHLNRFTTYATITENLLAYTPTTLFQHAISNPPFHATARGHTSPNPAIQKAHGSPQGQLTAWLAALHRCTTPTGTLTLILHSACQPEVLAFHTTIGGTLHLTPLQTAQAKPAKRLLAHLQKNGPAAVHHHPAIAAWEASLRQRILIHNKPLNLFS